MAPVTLPPSFHTSFWSPDYRSGLETLFKLLDAGCGENDQVAAFVENEMRAHHALAEQLSFSSSPVSDGDSTTTSSLQHTLLSLRSASAARAGAHNALATELANSVWMAFSQWKDRHKERIKGSRDDLLGKEGVITAWEKEVKKLVSLKQNYVVKTRIADDSEDDAKFAPAPANPILATADKYTSSPKPSHIANKLSRSGTVSDRISEKLRAASISTSGHRSLSSVDEKQLPAAPEPPTSAPLAPLKPVTNPLPESGDVKSPSSPGREQSFIPPTEPDGKPTIHSTTSPAVPSDGDSPSSPLPDLPPTTILLSGLSLPARGLRDLLRRFDAYTLSTPAPYSPSPSQYPSTRSNAALASRHRSTILGAYEKTFSGEEIVEWLRQNVEGFGGDWERCEDAAMELYRMGYLSRIGVGRGFDPSPETYFILKINPESGLNVGNPLSPAVSGNINSLIKSAQTYLPAGLGNDEPLHVRARRDAVKADESYRESVRITEDRRLVMVERIENALRNLGIWERERLRVVKTVLRQYDDAVQKLPNRLSEAQKGSELLIEAFNPEADITALIEGNRTGPYRPQPHIYESLESELPDVSFGIDLRRWSGDQGWKALVHAPTRPKGAIPDVLSALLQGLVEMRPNFQDEDNRKAWIYEVPLNASHGLRNLLNDPKLGLNEMLNRVKHFNPFVAAATVKLYLLELNPPVMGWEGWEDAKAVYPSVGADQERDVTSALTSVLNRLPGVHLFVLDAVVGHLKQMMQSTKADDSDAIYITKLALSVGRTILRPQYETEFTIQDRTPSLFLADLITHYSTVFPPLVERKKKDSERVMPVRKRTALVDQRMSRSRLGHEIEIPGVAENPNELAESGLDNLPTGMSMLGLGPILDKGKGKEVSDDNIQVVPPTPDLASTAQMLDNKEDKANDVSHAAITNVINDADTALATQAALKRASSGETSRLRGPRGARGPRPSSGRVPSSVGLTTVTRDPEPESLSAEEEIKNVSPISVASSADTIKGPSAGPVDPADYAPRKGKPSTPAGAFGHGARSSVSAAIAQFEGGQK